MLRERLTRGQSAGIGTWAPGQCLGSAVLWASLMVSGALSPAMADHPGAGGSALKSDDPFPVLDSISRYVYEHPEVKPLKRTVLALPADADGPLCFRTEEEFTQPILQAYLDRALVHMNLWDERSMRFFESCGVKFIHWADLGWNRAYTASDWERLTAAADRIHGSDWGRDVILECGIMEAVHTQVTSSFRIPDWYLRVLTETGIQERRVPGPNGLECFNYDAMFDRNAPDWQHLVGLWSKGEGRESGPPDLTMLETQVYYAYLIAEYLDAGFEGIMFGQTMMTGARDHDYAALYALTRFARAWAAERAYRGTVTLTSHVIEMPLWPAEPAAERRPFFTHITWPTRLSTTDTNPFGMHFGPGVKAVNGRQGGAEIERLLAFPYDLPILLEVDNYGRTPGPSAVCEQGYDEITAFAAQPARARAGFLQHYYFASRGWLNAHGNPRVHLALVGNRCLNLSLSLGTDADGEPFPATSFYVPFAEMGGDEHAIAEALRYARSPEWFAD